MKIDPRIPNVTRPEPSVPPARATGDWQRFLERSYVSPQRTVHVIQGETPDVDSGSFTLQHGYQDLLTTKTGIPVLRRMATNPTRNQIVASWRATSHPDGVWTLNLMRRRGDTAYEVVARSTITTTALPGDE